MKKILIIWFVLISSSVFSSEIYDVFRHQKYRYNLRVFKEKMKTNYTPSEFEFVQAKIIDASDNIVEAEEKLKHEILGTISNEFEYFKVQTLFKKQIEQLNKFYALMYKHNEYYVQYEATPTNQLQSIEIDLLSVVNDFATYKVIYKMEVKTSSTYQKRREQNELSQYYLVHLKTGKINKITPPNQAQKVAITKGVQVKLKRLYLLQTQKLSLSEIERIRNIDEEDNIDFSNKIDFSEAVIYPVFSGLLVSFPAFSKSSEIFNYESFRVFIDLTETRKIIPSFPMFKEIFNRKLNPLNQEIIALLDNDNNFDVSLFRKPPKDLDLFKSIQNERPVRSLVITSYNQKDDTTSILSHTKTYLFNQNQTLNQFEERNGEGGITKQTLFYYDAVKRKITQITKSDEKLDLYYYTDNILTNHEAFYLDTDFGEGYFKVELEVDDEHHFYIDNYRYTYNYSMVGDPDYGSVDACSFRSVEDSRFCNNYFCYLLNKKGRIIGIEKSDYGLNDIRTDSNGYPSEAYFGNQDVYSFDYDTTGKIQKYQFFNQQKLIEEMNFEYPPDGSLLIRTIKQRYSSQSQSTKTMQIDEYNVVFWE